MTDLPLGTTVFLSSCSSRVSSMSLSILSIDCDIVWLHTLRCLLVSVKKSRRCIHLCGNLSEGLGHGVDFSTCPISQLRGVDLLCFASKFGSRVAQWTS